MQRSFVNTGQCTNESKQIVAQQSTWAAVYVAEIKQNIMKQQNLRRFSFCLKCFTTNAQLPKSAVLGITQLPAARQLARMLISRIKKWKAAELQETISVQLGNNIQHCRRFGSDSELLLPCGKMFADVFSWQGRCTGFFLVWTVCTQHWTAPADFHTFWHWNSS